VVALGKKTHFRSRGTQYLHSWEANTNKEVGRPVDEHSNGHGSGAWTLGEEFGSDHPRNRARTHSKEHDEAQH